MHYRVEVLLSFNRAEMHQNSNYFMAVTCESWKACTPRIKKKQNGKIVLCHHRPRPWLYNHF